MMRNGPLTPIYDLPHVGQVRRTGVLRDRLCITDTVSNVASNSNEFVQLGLGSVSLHFAPCPMAAQAIETQHLFIEAIDLL